MIRCPWATDELYCAYHDLEWGVPLHDDRRLFEMLILEGAQAGLSWITILKKRKNYRVAFDHFDAEKIAHYDDHKFASLMANAGIVRNRLKIAATIQNAKAFLAIKESHDSFDAYIWQFANDEKSAKSKSGSNRKPKQNHWRTQQEVPAQTAASAAMCKDLRQRGFKFVGSTICYAFMQAVGMVNDHLVSCHRHREVAKLRH